MGARGYACCDLHISGVQNIDVEVSLGRTNGLRHDRVNSGPFPQTWKTLPGINDRGGYRGPEVTICSGTQGTSDPLCCLFLKDMKMSTSGHSDGILRYWWKGLVTSVLSIWCYIKTEYTACPIWLQKLALPLLPSIMEGFPSVPNIVGGLVEGVGISNVWVLSTCAQGYRSKLINAWILTPVYMEFRSLRHMSTRRTGRRTRSGWNGLLSWSCKWEDRLNDQQRTKSPI